MAGIKGNRRTIYTKKVIKESLIELLQSKEIHQITVTDICKNADINRGTFYLHYKDAFDLLESIEDELFNEFLKHVENFNDTSLLNLLEIIKDNKELCTILFCKQKDTKILNRLIYLARKVDIESLVEETNNFNEVYMDYFIKHSVGGVLAIIQTWLENGLVESPQEILKIIELINKL